jgi:hypothetical protein
MTRCCGKLEVDFSELVRLSELKKQDVSAFLVKISEYWKEFDKYSKASQQMIDQVIGALLEKN